MFLFQSITYSGDMSGLSKRGGKGPYFQRPVLPSPSEMLSYYDRFQIEQAAFVNAASDIAKSLNSARPDFAAIRQKVETLSVAISESESLQANQSVSKILSELKFNIDLASGSKKGKAPYDYASLALQSSQNLASFLVSCMLSTNIAYSMEAAAEADRKGDDNAETLYYQQAIAYTAFLMELQKGNAQVEDYARKMLSTMAALNDGSKIWCKDPDYTRYYSKAIFKSLVSPPESFLVSLGPEPSHPAELVLLPGKEAGKKKQSEFFAAYAQDTGVGPNVMYAGLPFFNYENPQSKDFWEGVMGFVPFIGTGMMANDTYSYLDAGMYPEAGFMAVLTAVSLFLDIASVPSGGVSQAIKHPFVWAGKLFRKTFGIASEERAFRLILEPSIAEREIVSAVERQALSKMKSKGIQITKEELSELITNKSSEFIGIWDRKAGKAVASNMKKEIEKSLNDWLEHVYPKCKDATATEHFAKLSARKKEETFRNIVEDVHSNYRSSLRLAPEVKQESKIIIEKPATLVGKAEETKSLLNESFPNAMHPLGFFSEDMQLMSRWRQRYYLSTRTENGSRQLFGLTKRAWNKVDLKGVELPENWLPRRAVNAAFANKTTALLEDGAFALVSGGSWAKEKTMKLGESMLEWAENLSTKHPKFSKFIRDAAEFPEHIFPPSLADAHISEARWKSFEIKLLAKFCNSGLPSLNPFAPSSRTLSPFRDWSSHAQPGTFSRIFKSEPSSGSQETSSLVISDGAKSIDFSKLNLTDPQQKLVGKINEYGLGAMAYAAITNYVSQHNPSAKEAGAIAAFAQNVSDSSTKEQIEAELGKYLPKEKKRGVSIRSPSEAKVGETITVSLFKDGKPYPNPQVEVLYPDGSKATYQVGNNGSFAIPLTMPGKHIFTSTSDSVSNYTNVVDTNAVDGSQIISGGKKDKGPTSYSTFDDFSKGVKMTSVQEELFKKLKGSKDVEVFTAFSRAVDRFNAQDVGKAPEQFTLEVLNSLKATLQEYGVSIQQADDDVLKSTLGELEPKKK
ncbi:MAG: hypothetical protein QW568_02245 [Candidatus Anstonellaceae archaeon]